MSVTFNADGLVKANWAAPKNEDHTGGKREVAVSRKNIHLPTLFIEMVENESYRSSKIGCDLAP